MKLSPFKLGGWLISGLLLAPPAHAQQDYSCAALAQRVSDYERAYASAETEVLPEAKIPLAYAYCSLAECRNQTLATSTEATVLIDKALAIVEQTDDSPVRVRTYLLASTCAEGQADRNEQVLGYSLKALQVARASQDSMLIVAAYTRVTDVYIERKDYNKADDYLKEAQELLGNLKEKLSLAPLYLQQSRVYLAENKPQKAIDGFQGLLSRAKAIDVDAQIKAYNGLEKAALALGDPINAQRYHKLAEELVAKKASTPATSQKQ